jgi:hypothetical protein
MRQDWKIGDGTTILEFAIQELPQLTTTEILMVKEALQAYPAEYNSFVHYRAGYVAGLTRAGSMAVRMATTLSADMGKELPSSKI